RVENIAAYNVPEKTGAEGFDFFGGIDLTLPEDIYAEKEIGLSVPIPDGSDILPEDRILLFKEIEFSGRTGVMLVNTAHVNIEENRIETASPPFPGARSKGRYMFFKPLYPDKMAIVTPSPMFGPGLIGMSSNDFGDIFADPLYYKTSPICMVPAEEPFDAVFLSSATGMTVAELGDLYIGDNTRFYIPFPTDQGKELEISSYPPNKPPDGDGDIPVNIAVEIEFVPAVTVNNVQLSESENGNSVPGNHIAEPSDDNAARVEFTPERRLKYGTDYNITVNVSPINGALPPPQDISLQFTTVPVKVISSAEIEFPSDIAILANGCGVAVANGTAYSGDSDMDSYGVVIIDYSDRKNLLEKYEKKISGKTLGVCDAGGEALSVSGGLSRMGVFNIIESGGLTPEIRGRTYLCQDNPSLINGYVMANVPPYSGIPRRVAFSEGAGAAYAATMGIGIQGVKLSVAR
ncbi:MAG: Ig-like domain-containing protein, partial [Gammaproteobacteria bacterium]|nr:Ig-like domain-containing protein [Gammaproteobacteria bacterium]